jgi:hypothetical protein
MTRPTVDTASSLPISAGKGLRSHDLLPAREELTLPGLRMQLGFSPERHRMTTLILSLYSFLSVESYSRRSRMVARHTEYETVQNNIPLITETPFFLPTSAFI